MMEGRKRKILYFLLTILCVLASVFCLPAMELNSRIQRIIRSGDHDGYDIVTLHAIDGNTKEEKRQTRRDIEAHAADPSSNLRKFSLQMTSGQRLRVTVVKRSIVTPETEYTVYTEEGERDITFKTPRDCFFSGDLEGEEEGYATLALCDGQLTGSLQTAKRTYEIHALSEDEEEDGSPDDVTQALVTWRDGETRAQFENDGIEIPEMPEGERGEESLQGHNGPEPAQVSSSLAEKRVAIEIGDYVDKFFIDMLKETKRLTTNKQIVNEMLTRWATNYAGVNGTMRGWRINFRIVHIHLMRVNPSWYRARGLHEEIYDRLDAVCGRNIQQNVLDSLGNYDQVTLHTQSSTDNRVWGVAYVGGLCLPKYRCAVVVAPRVSNTEMHELGHNLGLHHDKDMPECSGQGEGFMRHSYTFLPCYHKRLEDFFKQSSKSCVFDNAYKKPVKVLKAPKRKNKKG